MLNITAIPNIRRAVQNAINEETFITRRDLINRAYSLTDDNKDYAGRQAAEKERREANIALVAWEDALIAATKTVGLDYNPERDGDSFHVEFEWSFDVSCDLYVKLSWRNFRASSYRMLASGAKVHVHGATAKVEVGWGSTGAGSPAFMSAKLALYSQVVALAQQLEQALSEYTYDA